MVSLNIAKNRRANSTIWVGFDFDVDVDDGMSWVGSSIEDLRILS